jgi:NADPH2:quinone reductase
MPAVRVIRFHRTGGPEVLQLEELPAPTPGPREARVRVAFAGVNFIDLYLRSGLYAAGPLPATLGKEGAGFVEAIGPEVTEVALGDRVAFVDGGGSYAEAVTLAADRLLPVPPEMSDEVAAHPGDPYPEIGGRPGRRRSRACRGGRCGPLAVASRRATVLGTCSTPEGGGAGPRAALRSLHRSISLTDPPLDERPGLRPALDSVGQATFRGSVRHAPRHARRSRQSSGRSSPFPARCWAAGRSSRRRLRPSANAPSC